MNVEADETEGEMSWLVMLEKAGTVEDGNSIVGT